ncbi:CARDB domain-containing protein [Aneurinibacillus aneurinilyticus]|uniref:CARDB domain-containing protein n=1 Tax=Aneurinibacillus aneurinilyticus TaxID=1391 RepID=UPI0023F0D285|nr:CARDB domain-containing protein [Aneurinibacillus aneurinilyticus]
MIKKITAVALALTLSISSLVSAASLYPYGEKGYGAKNVRFKGNLSPSGLGVEERPSNVNRHDLRMYNINSKEYTPGSGYLQTVQYDIQPILGESQDKFSKKSGYHVAPLDEELIRDIAKKANGNPDYVWKQIDQFAKQAASSPSMSAEKVLFYKVDNSPYVNIGSIIYYSGGGDPDMVEVKDGNGITSPVFQTTYKTTNWPEILELKQDGQNVKVKAAGHSVYDALVSGQIIVNNDTANTKKVFTKNTPVSNYTVTYEGGIPLSDLPGLKSGENKVTLRVNDAFGRTAEKTISVNVVGEKTNLKVVDLQVSPNPLKQEGSGTATVVVQNESKETLTSPVVLNVDGVLVGTQVVTLAPGESKTLTFSFSVPAKKTIHIQATINPNRDQPNNETSYTDNTKDLSVRAIAEELEEKKPGDPGKFNLTATVPTQSDLRWGKKTPVYVVANNGGFYKEVGGMKIEYPVSFNTEIKVSYPGYSDTFVKSVTTEKPGKAIKIEVPTPDYKAFSTKYGTPIPEDGFLDINVQAHVNYDEMLKEEIDKSDNKASGFVRVYWSKTKIIEDKPASDKK